MNAIGTVEDMGIFVGTGVIIEDDYAPASKPANGIKRLMREVNAKIDPVKEVRSGPL